MELLRERKLRERLVAEEKREERVGIHDHFHFTFRVLPACTSLKTSISDVAH
jgi:hypothetical protein